MKFFVAFAAVVAVALATPHLHKPTPDAQLDAIIAAINSPSTDPATAALLEQQLQHIIAEVTKPEPIHVAPELVDVIEPIAVHPDIVEDFEQIAVGPTIIDDSIVSAPVSATPQASSPLVQIIVNVASAGQTPGAIGPIFDAPTAPESVNIVDQAPESVNVVDQAPESINIVEDAPESVNFVDQAPETVNIVQPIIPVPVMNLPETLN